MLRPIAVPAVLVLVALSGCGDDPAPPAQAPPAPPQGREETRKLEAAGAAGYDGAALRHSADQMLDGRDRQAKELEEARAPAPAADPAEEAK